MQHASTAISGPSRASKTCGSTSWHQENSDFCMRWHLELMISATAVIYVSLMKVEGRHCWVVYGAECSLTGWFSRANAILSLFCCEEWATNDACLCIDLILILSLRKDRRLKTFDQNEAKKRELGFFFNGEGLQKIRVEKGYRERTEKTIQNKKKG